MVIVELRNRIFGELFRPHRLVLFAHRMQEGVHQRGAEIEGRIFRVDPTGGVVGEDRDLAVIGDQVGEAIDGVWASRRR